jgi:hypothetical protein
MARRDEFGGVPSSPRDNNESDFVIALRTSENFEPFWLSALRHKPSLIAGRTTPDSHP